MLKPLTVTLLALAGQSYDNYGSLLRRIKRDLAAFDLVGSQRVETFERILSEELLHTNARLAYCTAIKIALGEEDVERHFHPQVAVKK
jgi:phage-related baseplate assembly protein